MCTQTEMREFVLSNLFHFVFFYFSEKIWLIWCQYGKSTQWFWVKLAKKQQKNTFLKWLYDRKQGFVWKLHVGAELNKLKEKLSAALCGHLVKKSHEPLNWQKLVSARLHCLHPLNSSWLPHFTSFLVKMCSEWAKNKLSVTITRRVEIKHLPDMRLKPGSPAILTLEFSVFLVYWSKFDIH